MSRPAIIIGLGGTGQWVLTFVKKDLLEINNGKMPDNVRLLAFDTMPQATAEAESVKTGREMEVKAGAVRLETGTEFIHIYGNLFDLSQQVANGQHRHLGSWYAADYWLRTLPPGSFDLSSGAGAIRQFGRAAIFKDLSEPASSELWTKLTGAIHAVSSQVSDHSKLEVIIVGSFAGGTGAGMFIDVANLLRAVAARNVGGNHLVRGIFVLPRAFSGAGGIDPSAREMLARSFAAWRELDRFMIVNDRWGLRRILYHDQVDELQLTIEKRPFDVCYLVDGERQNPKNPLKGLAPWKGVFPSIADFVSAILDTTAGGHYTEHVTTNLAPSFARREGESLYSAIGTYTIKAPVYYTLQEFSHSFTRDLLDRFVRPIIKDGRVVGVETARNPEVGEGKDGRTAALDFLKQTSVSFKEEKLQNTHFPRQVARISEQQGAENAKLVHSMALGGFATMQRGKSSGETYLGSLTLLGEDQKSQDLQRDVDKELHLMLIQEAPPGRELKEEPVQTVHRLDNKIPQFIREHYGTQTVGGAYIPGKYGETLRVCQRHQVERFREFLRLYMLDLLNGQQENAIAARTGKIGYTYAFLDELTKVFDYFLQFLRKVREDRETMGLLTDRQTRAGRAYESMKRNATRKFLFMFVHPSVYDTQERYINAKQDEINVTRDEMLLAALKDTSEQMRDIAIQARDEMLRWVQYLATGDAPTGAVGLYSAVLDSLDKVKVTHRYDKELQSVQKLVADQDYQEDDSALARALQSIKWDIVHTKAGLKISCALGDALLMTGAAAMNNNLNHFLTLGEKYFALVPEQQKIGDLLANDAEYRGDGANLAVAIDKMAEPLRIPPATSGRGPEKRYNYVRVASRKSGPQVANFFIQMKDKLIGLNVGAAQGQDRTGAGMVIELVDSEDEHKLTVVRSDDMIVSRDFAMWSTCRDEYIKQIQTAEAQRGDGRPGEAARRLHVYPAEANAIEFEVQLARIGKNYDTFHPKVVMLLEDKTRVQQFFQCLAYGFIQELKDDQLQVSWQLVLPDASPKIFLTKPVHQTESARPDVFAAMSRFVLDGRDAGGTSYRVNYDRVRNALMERERTLGTDGIIERLNYEIEKGFISAWRNKVEADRKYARDTGVPEQLADQRSEEWEDLADLAHLMLFRIIDVLKS